MLVEPQPLAFEALRRNYAALNRNIAFVPAAVSDRAGSLPLYSLTEEFIRARSLPEWSREIASFDPAHLSKHFADAEMHSIDVPVITFAHNDLPFEDPVGTDHDLLGAGLRKALYNYMHGVGLDLDVREWFEGSKVPRTTVPRTLVEHALG